MKKLIVAFLMLMFCTSAIADQNITFIWDHNDPLPEGYRIFQRTVDQPYDYTSWAWTGSSNTATLTLANGSYAFVVRAYVGDIMGGNSNEVTITIDDQPPPVHVPGRPKTFTIIFE